MTTIARFLLTRRVSRRGKPLQVLGPTVILWSALTAAWMLASWFPVLATRSP